MHSCQDIEENRHFSNDGTNLHIHAIAQGRPEDNQVEILQGPHGIVNPPKNLVLNTLSAKDGDLRLSASNACLPKTEISVFVTECVFFIST